jgi:hypothetical protein
LKELYKSKELDKDRPASIEADFEEVAASCGYFSFSLQDFASEMQNYLTILEELKEETERTKNRSWRWILFWQKDKIKGTPNPDDPEQEVLVARSGLDQPDASSKNIPELVMGRQGSVWNGPKEETNATRDFYRKMLNVFRIVERDDCKFLSCIFSWVLTIC